MSCDGERMTIGEKLRIIEAAKHFEVSKTSFGYEVEDRDHDLSAVFSNDLERWSYRVTGIYNSSCDSLEIDIDALDRLVKFTECLGTASGRGSDGCD